MTQTIRVEQLLRESVSGPYCDLVTRPTGRAVRTSIQRRLTVQHTALALLDFSEVGLVDFSCADEVIAKLLLEPGCDTAIVLQGLREEQLEAIEHVLEHHDIAVRPQLEQARRHPGRLAGTGRGLDDQAAMGARKLSDLR